MAVFKLQLEDFSTNKFELIAIHTSTEVSKLAYLLNKNLNTQFCFFDVLEKKEKNITGSFERYHYNDDKNEFFWNLLVNKSVISTTNDANFLFQQMGQTMYLIPEFKQVDFFLKIETDEDFFDFDAINKQIQAIKNVSMSYMIDQNKIKVKSNLIF